MGLLRNSVGHRFPVLGLLSDLALVGGAAQRLAKRRKGSDAAPAMSAVELALAASAALRLVRRWRGRGRRRSRTTAAA